MKPRRWDARVISMISADWTLLPSSFRMFLRLRCERDRPGVWGLHWPDLPNYTNSRFTPSFLHQVMWGDWCVGSPPNSMTRPNQLPTHLRGFFSCVFFSSFLFICVCVFACMWTCVSTCAHVWGCVILSPPTLLTLRRGLSVKPTGTWRCLVSRAYFLWGTLRLELQVAVTATRHVLGPSSSTVIVQQMLNLRAIASL